MKWAKEDQPLPWDDPDCDVPKQINQFRIQCEADYQQMLDGYFRYEV